VSGWWISLGTNKADRHDITEKLLKVALNTITLTLTPSAPNYSVHSYATDYGYNVQLTLIVSNSEYTLPGILGLFQKREVSSSLSCNIQHMFTYMV
jgi:hypothetical protein